MGTVTAGMAGMAGVVASTGSSRSPAVLAVLAGFAAVSCLGLGIRFWRRRWAILDTPTSKCVAVFVGRNEVRGRAEPSEESLTAPVTREPTVWFRWKLERWVRRGRSSRWETVGGATSDQPFWVVDDTGRVLVHPGGAEIHAPQVLRARAHDSGVTHMRHGERPIAELGRRYRITEWCIRPGQQVYVLGTASPRDDAVALQFAAGDDEHLLISTHSEARMARASLLLSVVNLAVAWVAAALLPATIHNGLTWHSSGPEPGSPSTLDAVGTWMLATALTYGGVLLAVYWLRVYNRLVAVKQQAANAWSLIDVALRRRHDLLPNLAEVAERYAEHERDVIEAVVRARAGALVPAHEELPTDTSLQRAGELNRTEQAGARSLLALAERYPNLEADEVFHDLARRITDTENQVASARGFYNDAVTVLRDRRRTFPGILLAGAVRTPSWNLFDADEGDALHPLATTSPRPPDRAQDSPTT